jgi:ankyrin repeat protein
VARNKSGATPLHLALQENCSFSKIKTLVKAHDAALQVEDEEGRIPLHVALMADTVDAKTIKLLTKTCPSSLTIRNSDGDTPLQIAKSQGIKDAEILTALRLAKS